MTYARIITRKILLERGVKTKIITDRIMGKIEKVVIDYEEGCTPETNIMMMTSDGEEFLNVTGNKSSIYYPRNWNAQNQEYIGVNVMSEGVTPTSERYVCAGSILIVLTGAGEKDIIRNISILIEGTLHKAGPELYDTDWINSVLNKIEERKRISKAGGLYEQSGIINPKGNDNFFNARDMTKADAGVSSATTGVYNPVHGRRRRMKKYMEKVLSEILKEEKKSMSIEKQTEGVKDMSEFISDSLFNKKFEGISKVISDRVKDYLVRSLTNGTNPQVMIDHVKREKGIDAIKAETIVRTEIQALQNSVREWSYKKIDPENKNKYFWLSVKDDRQSDVCKRIAEITKNGVPLDKLRETVKEESIRGGLDGSREWTPHPNCRSTWARKFD